MRSLQNFIEFTRSCPHLEEICMSKSKLTFSIKPDSGKNSWFLTFCNWSVDNTSNYISNDLLKNCLTDEEFRSCKFQVPQSTTIFEFFNEISVVWILISTVLHTPDTLPHLFVYFRNVKLVSWFFVYIFGKIILSLHKNFEVVLRNSCLLINSYVTSFLEIRFDRNSK